MYRLQNKGLTVKSISDLELKSISVIALKINQTNSLQSESEMLEIMLQDTFYYQTIAYFLFKWLDGCWIYNYPMHSYVVGSQGVLQLWGLVPVL